MFTPLVNRFTNFLFKLLCFSHIVVAFLPCLLWKIYIRENMNHKHIWVLFSIFSLISDCLTSETYDLVAS